MDEILFLEYSVDGTYHEGELHLFGMDEILFLEYAVDGTYHEGELHLLRMDEIFIQRKGSP